MLLDPETFDLVQHVDTVLEAMAGHEFEAHVNPELMQSVIEVATPVCRTPADVERALRQLRAVRDVDRAGEGPARRLGRHAPVQPLRAPAHHRARPLPQPRRPDAVRRAPRADLRAARARRGRGSRHGDSGRERPADAARTAARALRELAVLARRADGPRFVAADDLRRVPALRPAAAVPRTTPTTRRSSGSSRRPAASRTTRTSGGTSARTRDSARSRCGSATPSRGSRTRSRSRRTCQALVKLLSERAERGEKIPTYHRILTTENKWLAGRYGLEAPIMDLETGKRNRIPVAQLVRRTLKEIEPHARELGGRARARRHPRDPRHGQRLGPAATGLQREPRHRRGRAGDRNGHRDRAGRCV